MLLLLLLELASSCSRFRFCFLSCGMADRRLVRGAVELWFMSA